MELKIYDKQGIVKMTVSPDNSSQWNHEVGVENVVTVNFTMWEFLVLEVGWYILVENQKFSIKSEYRPKHIHNTKYTYNLKFYGREHDAQDILFCRLNQGEDDLESVFAYDGTPMDFLQKVVANMNRNTDGVEWKAGEAISANRQTINFNGLYCWDALGEIARAFGTEWWMDGEYLNISKCERGESVSLGYGQGLKSGLTQNENTNAVKWFTRLIPVGSSKNIDKSKYGYATLQLPGREKYIDINTQYGLKEYREEAAFSEIYPHRVGTISSVRSEAKIDDQGEEYLIYYVKDTELPFNPDNYMLPGEVIHMSFNSGNLAGKEFEVNWNNSTEEFEIINQYPEYVDQLPGGNLIPSSGDQYVLSNISMPDEYNTIAEEAYQSAVYKYIQEYDIDISIYSGVTDYIYISKNNISLSLGKRVNLISKRYFDSGNRGSRITRISRKLNNLSEMTLECSNTISSTWKQALDSSINNTIVNQQKTQVKTDKNEKDISQISGLWELKKTEDGVEYLYTKFNVLTALGFTAYSIGKEKHFPSIYDGLLIDNDTIYWEEIKDEEGNVISKKLKARGGSGEVVATMLGDLTNVGAWANSVAEEDRIMVQKKDSTTWVEMKLSELGGADFSKVSYYGAGNAFTSLELSKDGKSLYFYKGETFATHEDLLSKWTRDDVKIDNWDTAYGWGNHANAGYLKDADVSGKYLKLSGGVMGKDSSITSAYIYPLEDNKYALGLPNRAYGYVYSHRYFVDDLEIKKSQDDVLYIDANLVVRGGITMYGTDGTTASSIWDGAPKATTSDIPNGKGIASFDSKFFSVNNGHVSFIGDVGGGGKNLNITLPDGSTKVVYNGDIEKSIVLTRLYKSVEVTTASTDEGTITPLAMNTWTTSKFPLKDGTGAAGTWNISVLGSASKLSHKIVYPSTQYSGRYCKFASLSLTNRYTSKLVHCELSVASSIIKGVGRSCKVYCSIYQQDAMGNAPVYTFKSDIIPDGVISIFGVLNYNSSSSTIDLYISANQQYISVNGISLEGEDLIKNETSSNTLTSIPSGTVIKPSLDGYVERASQLNGLYSSKKGGVTNLLTNGNSEGMANDYNFASYTYASDVFQYTTDSNGQVVHDGMYTLTFCGKLGQENTHIAAFWDGGDANHTVIESLSSTEERIVSITARITNKQTLRFYQYPKGKTGSYIKWAVLEKAENVTEEGGTFLCNARRIDFTPGSNDLRMIADGNVSIIRHFAPKSGSGTPGFSFHTITGGTLGWMGAAFSDNTLSYYGFGSSPASPIVKIDTSGNLLTTGGITMYSDERKKTILNHVELSLKQVADAPIIEHYYNSDDKKTTHVGSIAQYWAGLNDWFCKEDGDGFLTMEIQNAALASAISVARELVRYESKTDKQIRLLKKRICELEDEIETLKGK